VCETMLSPLRCVREVAGHAPRLDSFQKIRFSCHVQFLLSCLLLDYLFSNASPRPQSSPTSLIGDVNTLSILVWLTMVHDLVEQQVSDSKPFCAGRQCKPLLWMRSMAEFGECGKQSKPQGMKMITPDPYQCFPRQLRGRLTHDAIQRLPSCQGYQFWNPPAAVMRGSIHSMQATVGRSVTESMSLLTDFDASL